MCHPSACTAVRRSLRTGMVLCLRSVTMLAVGAGAACAPSGPAPRLTVEELLREPAESTPAAPAALDPTRRRITLTAAINETVSTAFAFESGSTAWEDVTLSASPFEGPAGSIAPSAVEVYRIHAVPVARWPGWHIRTVPPELRPAGGIPDVLVPLDAPRGGLPNRVGPREALHFWVDLCVPKATGAGVYAGNIVLRSGDTDLARLDVELNVLPFVLPDDAGIVAITELDHRALANLHLPAADAARLNAQQNWLTDPAAPAFLDLIHDTLRLLDRHRVAGVLPALAPDVTVDRSGETRLAWETYDAVAAPYLDGAVLDTRTPPKFWPLPTDAWFGDLGRPASAGFERLRRDVLRRSAEHFGEQGWLPRAYLRPPDVPLGTSASISALHALASARAEAGVRAPLVAPLCPQDMRPYGWIGYVGSSETDAVDVWCPPAQFLDPAALGSERARGRQVWFAPDRPPYSGTTSVFGSPGDTLVIGWQALQVGAEAVWLGPALGDAGVTPPAAAASLHRGEGALLYSGAAFGLDRPVPSIRLKRLRRTMQDAAYVALLNTHGQEHITRALTETLGAQVGTQAYRTHFSDGRGAAWPAGWEAYELARSLLYEAMRDVAEGGRQRMKFEQIARSTAWRRLMTHLRTVSVEVEGTRLRRLSGGEGLRADCTVVLVNRGRAPAGGELIWGSLPEGWSADPQRVAVAPVPAGGARRVTLAIFGTHAPVGPGGHVFLPITWRIDAEQTIEFAAPLSLVSAVRVAEDARPPSIDGDLRDWPIGGANVAGDFALVSGPVAGAWPRPTRGVVAYALSDSEYLYLGVSCDGPPEAPADAPRTNAVQYDDLVPSGEELIEILLDPLNAGTRSPADLYHVVVKPSGAVLTEQGIRFDPPCGARRPWPADVVAATRTIDDGWTAEVRIPRSALGGATSAETVCGLNITRFDDAHQELCTWSGAVGNAYDPMGLGNVLLP